MRTQRLLHPSYKRFASSRKPVAALAALAAGLVPAAHAADAAGAEQEPARDQRAAAWTRWIDVDLSARKLGLRADASAHRVAREALRRNARRLGLRRSGLRLAGDIRMPAADGARAVRYLRFQQTAAGLRVVWSQIDVTVAAGRVRSIAATVVPVKAGAAAGERRVSRERALRIARRAVAGPEQALRPLQVAYAGAPTTDRGAKRSSARRAWVVEVQPAPAGDEDAPVGLCIVVDAETGKVIASWPGMADRPDRGSDARGPSTALAGTHAAQVSQDPRESPATVLQVFDGTGQVMPTPSAAPMYSSFRTTGSTRVNEHWPSYLNARLSGVDANAALEAVGANAANVARTICVVRGWCGRTGGFQPDSHRLNAWTVVGNTTDTTSRAQSATLRVFITDDNIMYGSGDPNQPHNDIVAHEFGHIMDWIYAGDRVGGQALEGSSVQEALADMFAYDYDRGDATIGEDAGGAFRNWQNPGSLTRGGQPYPDHMNDYDPTPPINSDGDPSPHFNSTILSHAYYRVVQSIGHNRAGRVLHNVPQRLSPRPTFREVRRAFSQSASVIYGATDAFKVQAAFSAVGLEPPPHQEPDCGPNAC